MNELQEKAENYTAEKMNELMAKAIAQAYADGYRDGYDEAESKGSSARINNAEVFDLGLPSKTWWSLKYLEDEKGDTNYLSYPDASKLGLPTKEQVEELMSCCELRQKRSNTGQTFYGIYCLGNTGNEVYIDGANYKIGDVSQYTWGNFDIYFWIRDDEDGNQKNAVRIVIENGEPVAKIVKLFSGYKLPVLIVRKK